MGATQSHLDGNSTMGDVVSHAYQLATAFATPSTLKALVELDVLEIIAGAGPNAQLSAAQIASKIPTTNPQAPVALDRMMRYLASHSVFACSQVTSGDGTIERLYGLTPVSRLFTKNQSDSPFPSLLLMHQDKVQQDCWQELKYAVLDDVTPFTKVHGMEFFEYRGKDPRFSSIFNHCMSRSSSAFVEKMLDTYTGFHDVKELVDVGGGNGTTLHMIVSKYPNIKAVNFDLTQVIFHAPSLPGVEHVGGDMFANVPNSETIFMKFILHSWSDEQCVKLLKNCFKALPSSGKVIIVDTIIPEAVEPNVPTENYLWLDLVMLVDHSDAKERTKKEFELLAKEAGFSQLDVTCCPYGVAVMELLK